jgi:hypothetical protein
LLEDFCAFFYREKDQKLQSLKFFETKFYVVILVLSSFLSVKKLSLNKKVKIDLRTGHKGSKGEQRYSSTLSLTSALDGGGWLTPRSGFYNPENDPVTIVQENGWAQKSVWTCA